MKILILSDSGITHTKRWVKALSEKGVNILLFSLRNCDRDFYSTLKNVKLITAENQVSNSLISKLKYLKCISKINKEIRDFQPDILHAHYASSYGLLGSLAKHKCPFVISVWGSDIYDFPNTMPLGRKIISYNLRKADYILSTSYIMANETKKYTNKPIEITPFGVDVNLFKPSNISLPSNVFRIGNVKALTPKYGIDILIKSFAILLDKNPRKDLILEIYGDGPNRKEYENLALSLKISDKVKFHGFLDNSLLPSVYNSFSVSVSVSVSNSESFGVVAVEAMSCGCPVVTSDADGFTEVVEDGITGFIVPKNNVEETAKTIQKFIDDPSLREKMGKEGRKRVLELYNWEENVNRMVNIYTKIIRNK